MNPNLSIIRALHPIEQAFTISNEAAPLVVVCILHLNTGPEIAKLERALEQLQKRHILLQAGIISSKGRLYFQQPDPMPPIVLEVVPRTDSLEWRGISELALNTRFATQGPLMKCWYLPSPEKAGCELVICFHHAIIDGTAARLILHELLSLCGSVPLPAPIPPLRLHEFPSNFRKWDLAKRLVVFVGRQLAGEWRHRKNGVTSPSPDRSQNAIISLRLDAALSRKLTVRIGREGLSLNSVLLAAITQAVLHYRYPGQKGTLARAISFADLRPSLQPVVSGEELGCYISMLRLEVPTTDETSIWTLSAGIRRAIFQASRRGEVFLMSIISKHLVRMVFRLQNTRLGVSALSFIGKLDLQPQYGTIQLHEVRAFITNNRFGPEFSGFGKILFGSIGLDFTYLTAEMDAEQAGLIVAHIKKSLEKMAD